MTELFDLWYPENMNSVDKQNIQLNQWSEEGTRREVEKCKGTM